MKTAATKTIPMITGRSVLPPLAPTLDSTYGYGKYQSVAPDLGRTARKRWVATMSLILIDQQSESRAARLAAIPLTTDSGVVLTTIQPGRAIVWLVGDIDRSIWPDLQGVVHTVKAHAPHVVLDPARMTGCDESFADFVRALSGVAAITIRRPSQALRRLLTAWTLDGLVQIADFPGPAPLVPA